MLPQIVVPAEMVGSAQMHLTLVYRALEAGMDVRVKSRVHDRESPSAWPRQCLAYGGRRDECLARAKARVIYLLVSV